MGKSTKRGPDWTDVLVMIQALEALHGVSIEVELRPMVGQIGAAWIVELHATDDQVVPTEDVKKYIWSRQAGAGTMEELGSALYNGCYELEKKLMRKQWVQLEIPQA